MNVIITMAGRGSRFTKEGFKKKKFELLVKKKPIFDWALLSLQDFFNHQFVFFAKSGDEKFIRLRCKKLGIKKFSITVTNKITDGQATSALLALKSINNNHGVLIYNIDTHIKPGTITQEDIKPEFDGYITVFKINGDHWSFAKLDQNNRVIDTAEKKRISSWATTGIYYFKNAALYRHLYKIAKKAIPEEMNEFYIAPMYKFLINECGYVYGHTIDRKNVIPLGTPKEVKDFDPQFYENNK